MTERRVEEPPQPVRVHREIGAVAPRSLNHPAAIVHARRDQFDRIVLDRWRDDDGVAKQRLRNGAVIELRRRGLHVDGRLQFVNQRRLAEQRLELRADLLPFRIGGARQRRLGGSSSADPRSACAASVAG